MICKNHEVPDSSIMFQIAHLILFRSEWFSEHFIYRQFFYLHSFLKMRCNVCNPYKGTGKIIVYIFRSPEFWEVDTMTTVFEQNSNKQF